MLVDFQGVECPMHHTGIEHGLQEEDPGDQKWQQLHLKFGNKLYHNRERMERKE